MTGALNVLTTENNINDIKLTDFEVTNSFKSDSTKSICMCVALYF